MNKFRAVVKHAIVGAMETVSLTTMIGASALLRSQIGTLVILIGLVIGVVGLAVYDVWRV